MLEACNSCGFEAASPSDFERLNNAIVKAAARGGAFAKLNDGWQDEVVEERSWKMAIPPLWSSLLESYWIQYGKLYRTAAPGLVNPYAVAPTGISGALRDLYAPTVQLTQQAQQKAEQVLKEAQATATTKIKNALRAAGKLTAEGAAEETKDQATNWGVWAAGLGALGLAGYLVMRGRGGFAGLNGVDDDCQIRGPLNRPRGKFAVNCTNTSGWKNRGQRLADAVSRGNYTGRLHAYIMNASQVELFRKLYDAGWDASSITGDLRDPQNEKRTKAEARKLLR